MGYDGHRWHLPGQHLPTGYHGDHATQSFMKIRPMLEKSHNFDDIEDNKNVYHGDRHSIIHEIYDLKYYLK